MNGKKRTTTRDIAKACFVSQSAVSMILSGREDIHFATETIERVKRTAKEMGYEYRGRAKKKKTGTNDTIMIMCPSLATQYYTTLIQFITQEAQEHGLYTLIAYTNRSKEREEYYLNMASDTGFYGIIYTYTPRAVSFLNHLYEKLPLVLINDHNPDLKMELLELDSKKSGRLIAAHLLELGHRDIGYMTTPLSSIEVPRRRRLEGMQEEYERQGLDSSFIHVISGKREEQETITGNKHYDTGYGLTRKYFKKREDILKKKEETNAELENITAFVGTNDFVAIGIMDAITSLGYRIPEDFSVCGFDNTLVASFSGISLTTIDHCIGEKGAYAVSMLRNQRTRMEQKDDKKEKKRPIMRLEYEPQLIIRHSTGKRR
ncbi:MAG: LacI family DNA-binding transcriptional regulator [Eubacterium sp.]|nr:LacI family DNA-binding transcriptional regulator [Eubacterium sp.]